jgi:hypothetical protein
MAILFNKQSQTTQGDPPSNTPSTSTGVAKLFNTAPFMKSWYSDPITKAKMEVIQPGLGDKYYNELKGITTVDMNAVTPGNIPTIMKYYEDMDWDKKRPGISKFLNTVAMNYTGDKSVLGLSGNNTNYNFSPIVAAKVTDPSNPDKGGYFSHEGAHNKLSDIVDNFILNKWGNKKLSEEQLRTSGVLTAAPGTHNYEVYKQNISKTEGIYPRIAQVRSVLGLIPGQQVTAEHLNSPAVKETMRGLLFNYDIETLLDIFNTVAKNDAVPVKPAINRMDTRFNNIMTV